MLSLNAGCRDLNGPWQPSLGKAARMFLDHRLSGAAEWYKLFYDALALEGRLSELGWSISVSKTERFFIYGQGRRQAA